MTANPSLSLDLLADLRELVAFPFMVHALEAGTIVAVLAATVGWFMVLRRQSFAGHTLSVMAFPGATGAVLAGAPASLGYYLACAATALAIGRARGTGARGPEPPSAAIGTIQAAGLGTGFLFLALGHGVLGGPETLLFGSFLGVSAAQVLGLLVVSVGALGALALFGRRLLFATVDREVAHARGVPVAALDVGFLLLLAVAVAATSQVTGVLLVLALLVAPPATAQCLTARPALSLALSAGIAVLVAWLGLAAAYFSVYPVGFFTTTFAFGAYLLARVARSERLGRRAPA